MLMLVMNIKQKVHVFVLALGLLVLPMLASAILTQPAMAYKCSSVGGLQLTYKDGACYLPATDGSGKETKIATEKPIHNDNTPITDWECASSLKYNASAQTCEKCTAFGSCQADTTVVPLPKGEDKTELVPESSSTTGDGTTTRQVDDSGKNRSKSGKCAGEKTDYFGCAGDGVTAIVGIVKIIILIVSVGVGIVAVGGLVYGAILYASAQDNQEQVSKSIKVIRSVITGLLLYMFMVAIINFLVPGGVFSAPPTTQDNVAVDKEEEASGGGGGLFGGLFGGGGSSNLKTPVKVSGDPTFAAALKKALGKNYKNNNVSAAFIDMKEDVPRYAHLGDTNDDTLYEIGSISKLFTGNLLAEAIKRGEVTADQPLGTLLPFPESAPVREVTLRELATHRSGLPSLPKSQELMNNYKAFQATGADPYTFDVPQMMTQAVASYNASSRGKYAYSNIGAALLGHALGKAAGMSYKELLESRMFGPLGMGRSIFPETPDNLPEGSLTGKTAAGRAVAPWTLYAYAPAGGIRSSVTEMALFARKTLEGTAPGMDATQPKIANSKTLALGWLWEIEKTNAQHVYAGHSGETGGFFSVMLVDPITHTGVVILSDNATNITTAGATLINNGGK
jgi:CubicO group peptidase (beta-lactamase class C family)